MPLKHTTLIVIIATFLLTACTGAANAPAQSGLPKVLATETFLRDIAQNVAGDRLSVAGLLPATLDPHEFQPSPQDVARISDCQVLIVNGLGYEGWLQETLGNAGGQRIVITATDRLTPADDPSGEHPEGDPHMWMDPSNVVYYVETIRDELSRADPAGKDTYFANTQAYVAKLIELDRWIKDQVGTLPPEKRLLVTNHDALGYFSRAYGFTAVGAVIPSVTDQASPSAQEMSALIDTIKSSGAPAIFLDVGENQDLARQIASETGVKVITDLYVETISAPDGPAPTYIDMMKHDVDAIISALKQGPVHVSYP